MIGVVAAVVLGLGLVAAAGAKLLGGAGARAALATYGLVSPPLARAAWVALIGSETVLGVAVAAGSALAAYAAALFLAAACGVQGAALAAGRGGRPCACLGSRGRLGRGSLTRAALAAAALAILPQLPRADVTAQGWLAIGLAATLLGLLTLAAVVLALAREIGMLRLAVGQPGGALEIAAEGPELGARPGLAAAFAPELAGDRLGLAVFSSQGCGLCRSLHPVVAAFGRDPHVVLRTFDEEADADAWAAAAVPGSPFAVALDVDGSVLAKGTFNSGAQLESVLHAAERRRAEGGMAIGLAARDVAA